MRAAPPVQALSCEAGPWLRLQQALYALGAFVGAHWCAAWWLGGEAAPALAGLVAAAAAAIASRWLARPPSLLLWDSRVWALQPLSGARRDGRARLMLDLGGWLLVRFDAAAGLGRPAVHWLAFSRRNVAAAWGPLCVALHAPSAPGNRPAP